MPAKYNELKLRTRLSAFEALHVAADEGTARVKTTTVRRDALAALLHDHSAMVTALEDAGIRVMEPRKRGKLK